MLVFSIVSANAWCKLECGSCSDGFQSLQPNYFSKYTICSVGFSVEINGCLGTSPYHDRCPVQALRKPIVKKNDQPTVKSYGNPSFAKIIHFCNHFVVCFPSFKFEDIHMLRKLSF